MRYQQVIIVQENIGFNGAKAFMMAIPINDGNQDVAPKSANAGLECFVKTMPVINAVSVINERDLYPTL